MPEGGRKGGTQWRHGKVHGGRRAERMGKKRKAEWGRMRKGAWLESGVCSLDAHVNATFRQLLTVEPFNWLSKSTHQTKAQEHD